MKKKVVVGMLAVMLAMSACSSGASQGDWENEAAVSETTEIQEATETRETVELEGHIHAYVEEITTAASCETDGVKTFICGCGDSYTETVLAAGHSYENYVFNEDAAYLADGTETSVCSGCDLTDTRTAEGTKLEYTYMDMSVIKHAKSSVNVRNLPCTDGDRLGSLSTNQEVKVTGQCNETGWYRIEFGSAEAYVSNNYLVNEKTTVSQTTASVESGSTNADGGNAGTAETQNTGNDNSNSGDSAAPDSGNTNAGTVVPEPMPEPVPSETVKNPNGYPEMTYAEFEAATNSRESTLAPGTYYLVDTDQTATWGGGTSGGQTEDESGAIIDGDTGEVIRPATP